MEALPIPSCVGKQIKAMFVDAKAPKKGPTVPKNIKNWEIKFFTKTVFSTIQVEIWEVWG